MLLDDWLIEMAAKRRLSVVGTLLPARPRGLDSQTGTIETPLT